MLVDLRRWYIDIAYINKAIITGKDVWLSKTVRTAKFSPSEALPYTLIGVGAIHWLPTHLINYYVQNAFYYKFGLTNYENPPIHLACDHKSFIKLTNNSIENGWRIFIH